MRRGRLRISIFGLGYVGTVTAACLARMGHRVLGVDVNQSKVDMVNAARSPIVEPGLAGLMESVSRQGDLSATTDPVMAVRSTRVSMISVGTPGGANGSPDLRALFAVCRQIGSALRGLDRYHLIVIRSTCVPGTARRAARAIARASGLEEGEGFGLCVNPEFLREGSAITDFNAPAYTVVGAVSPRDVRLMRRVYSEVKGEFIVTERPIAEMIKYASNAFHAVKVTFANEIGAICKDMGIDSHALMELFCRDEKLNISRSYLKPGFAFGGSCLPKDLRALSQLARSRDKEVPLLSSTLESNQRQIEALVQRLSSRRGRRIGIIGLAFKSGTDDLRESPMVKVVEALLGKGFEIGIYDPNVSLSRLMGANKAYIEREIPHLSRLLQDEVSELIRVSDIVVIGGRDGLNRKALETLRRNQEVVDLVQGLPPGHRNRVRYQGLYW